MRRDAKTLSPFVMLITVLSVGLQDISAGGGLACHICHLSVISECINRHDSDDRHFADVGDMHHGSRVWLVE